MTRGSLRTGTVRALEKLSFKAAERPPRLFWEDAEPREGVEGGLDFDHSVSVMTAEQLCSREGDHLIHEGLHDKLKLASVPPKTLRHVRQALRHTTQGASNAPMILFLVKRPYSFQSGAIKLGRVPVCRWRDPAVVGKPGRRGGQQTLSFHLPWINPLVIDTREVEFHVLGGGGPCGPRFGDFVLHKQTNFLYSDGNDGTPGTVDDSLGAVEAEAVGDLPASIYPAVHQAIPVRDGERQFERYGITAFLAYRFPPVRCPDPSLAEVAIDVKIETGATILTRTGYQSFSLLVSHSFGLEDTLQRWFSRANYPVFERPPYPHAGGGWRAER